MRFILIFKLTTVSCHGLYCHAIFSKVFGNAQSPKDTLFNSLLIRVRLKQKMGESLCKWLWQSVI